MPTTASTDPPPPEGLQLRTALLLLTGVSIGSTALIISMTVTALVAESITGDAIWSGVPVAASVLGTAAGTSLLSMAMVRWGRRSALAVFYITAAAGGFLACLATIMASLELLIAGVFVVGVGNSANALTRYVAADLQTPERRATTVGWIVWAGTVGAVVGPNLLSPSDQAGVLIGLPPLSGTYLVSALTFLGAAALYLIYLRPSSLSSGEVALAGPSPAADTRKLFRLPHVQVSVIALVFGHVVMVLVMTMTPLHLKSAGHGLEVIGLVASSHIVGMFLFAPVVGLLVDRLGTMPVIFGGQTVLLLATLGGVVVPASSPVLTGATLFLLGLGWSLGFVAGSASLTRGIPVRHRTLLQGRTDSMVWVSAAGASLLSSLLFSTVGFGGLCMVGAATILVSLSTIAVRRRALLTPAEPEPSALQV